MNFLMLRGQIPQDRNPQEIVFDKLEDVDDMWTQLFYAMLGPEDQGELWYCGGTRNKKFAENFVERWVPSYTSHFSSFIPDVTFCRGGFKEYIPILRRFPKALKMYYGAGRRFIPQDGFLDYDILLQDSPTQVEYAMKECPNISSVLFFKPAPDKLFYPIEGIEKEYDVCYPADGRPPRKGHDFIYSTVPGDLKILNLGFPTKRFKLPSNIDSYRVLKPELSKYMQKCKIGIVASTNGTGLFGLSYDSCPRIIPEMIACGLPIVVLDELEFWEDKYINSLISSRSSWATGELANRENFWDIVRMVLENRELYNPRKYYEENLTIKHAAGYLREKINNELIRRFSINENSF